MGEAASDFVLTGDEIARLELGREVELRAAVGAEARGASGLAVASPTDRLAALGAEALVFGDNGILQDGAAASISATGGTDVTPAPIRASVCAGTPRDPAGRDRSATGPRGGRGRASPSGWTPARPPSRPARPGSRRRPPASRRRRSSHRRPACHNPAGDTASSATPIGLEADVPPPARGLAEGVADGLDRGAAGALAAAGERAGTVLEPAAAREGGVADVATAGGRAFAGAGSTRHTADVAISVGNGAGAARLLTGVGIAHQRPFLVTAWR